MTPTFHDTLPLPPELAAHALTPALVIDLGRVRHNLERVKAALGGDVGRWRPHIKTAKIPRVFRLMADAGVRHFKCATTREAACLLEALRGVEPAPDLLVAYPHRGPNLERLGQLARRFADAALSILTEDANHASSTPAALGLFLDVNLGMNRTGLDVDAVEAAADVAEAAGGRLRGLHGYEGHIHSGPRPERHRATAEALGRLQALRAAMDARGHAIGEVITSGTPSFVDALAASPFGGDLIHRVSPGTVVYHDVRSQQRVPEVGLLPAAVVLTRVVSHPAPDRVTCDAGSKSLAAEQGDPCVDVLGHPDLEADTPSEEHLPLRVLRGATPARGALLQLAPHHVCPTVNLADEALLVDHGRYLGREPVAARGHEAWLA